jgi:hypothetical protein
VDRLASSQTTANAHKDLAPPFAALIKAHGGTVASTTTYCKGVIAAKGASSNDTLDTSDTAGQSGPNTSTNLGGQAGSRAPVSTSNSGGNGHSQYRQRRSVLERHGECQHEEPWGFFGGLVERNDTPAVAVCDPRPDELESKVQRDSTVGVICRSQSGQMDGGPHWNQTGSAAATISPRPGHRTRAADYAVCDRWLPDPASLWHEQAHDGTIRRVWQSVWLPTPQLVGMYRVPPLHGDDGSNNDLPWCSRFVRATFKQADVQLRLWMAPSEVKGTLLRSSPWMGPV